MTSSASETSTMDNEKLQQFMGKILSDFGGAGGSVLAYIGDKLGSNNKQLQEQAEERYDLIAFFDSLHDMGDPQGAVAHALKTLKKPDGIVMIVEPFANDKLEDNLNPIGRIYYAGSTMICVPASLSHNGPALGAQAGEARISQIVKAGGFKHFRRATHTLFNIVYEAKA
jgi:hypothetical protein